MSNTNNSWLIDCLWHSTFNVLLLWSFQMVERVFQNYAWHLTASILSARVESSMSCKTSTRVAQVTGCLPLPFTHSRRIAVLICSILWWCSYSRFLTLDPFLSSRRSAPNWTYLIDISTAILIFLPPVCVNCSSSSRLSLVHKLCYSGTTNIFN